MRLCRGKDLALAAEAARSIHFSPHLVQLADNVVRAITDGGTSTFNGVHLRIEHDAIQAWLHNAEGIEVCHVCTVETNL